MSDWLDVPLAQVLDFKEGPGILAKDFRPAGVPLIRLAGVKSRDSILKGCNFLDPEMVERKWSHFRLEEGDVVLSTSASLGEVTVVGLDGVGAVPYTGLVRFRAMDGRILQRFIPLALTASTFKHQINAMGAGSVLKHFGPMHLRQMTLHIPSVEMQDAICEVIESIDRKLESCRSQVNILEALGAAILEDAVSLDEYGYPPYSATRLGCYLSTLESGSRPRGGVSSQGDGVISLGAENVQAAGISSKSEFKRVPSEFASRMRRGVLVDDDILVYKDGGKPGNFIPHVSAFGHGFPVPSATINEHVYRVRADLLGQGLLYWLLRSPWMDQEMRKRGTGVAIPGLNSTNFKGLPFPELELDCIERLRTALNPMLRAMLRLGAEMALLDDLRYSTLSGLMTGELALPRAESAA